MSFEVLAIVTGVMFVGHCRLGLSAMLEVTTQYYDDVIPNAFNIRCAPDRADDGNQCAKTVVLLQVSKGDDKPIAGIQGADSIYYGRLLQASVTAEGHIDRDLNETYLSVTVREAVLEDSGMYTCHVHYLDGDKRLRQETSSRNVTVEDQDVQDIIRHLMAKVSFLENMSNFRLNAVEKQLSQLELKTVEQEMQLKKLEAETKQNHTFTTAFSYGYNTGDLVLKQGDTIVFNQPIMDVGESYDSKTGIFTSPRRGLYVFHLFVATYTYGKEFHIDLVVNDVIVGTLFAMDKDAWDQPSTSTVVSLQPGDTVRPVVRYNLGSNLLFDRDHYSVFTGYLLKLM